MEVGKTYQILISEGLAVAKFTSKLVFIYKDGTCVFKNGVEVQGFGYSGYFKECENA